MKKSELYRKAIEIIINGYEATNDEFEVLAFLFEKYDTEKNYGEETRTGIENNG